MKKLSRLFSGFILLISSQFAYGDAPEVEVFTPQASTQQEILQLTGSIEAVYNAALAPLQSGVVQEIHVDAGSQVQKGDPLLTLDNTLARIELTRAQSALNAATVDLKEAQRLYDEVIRLSKQKLVEQTLIGQRQANLNKARAEHSRLLAGLTLAKELLRRHTLTAPFAGQISQRHVSPGEWITSQSNTFNLVDNQNLRVRVQIPQEYLPAFREPVNAISVTPDMARDQIISVSHLTLIPVSNPSTRAFSALIHLPESTLLIAGTSAEVSITLPQNRQTLVWLPESAIKQHPDGGFSVFAVNGNNTLKRKIVNIVDRKGTQVAVSGLEGNHPYVIKGIEKLKSGLKVLPKVSTEILP